MTLGKYDFKAGAFPATLNGEVVAEQEAELCGGSALADECGDYWDMLESPASSVRLVVPKIAWRGKLAVPDEDIARKLRDSTEGISGDVILEVQSVHRRKVQNKGLLARRQMHVKAMDDALKPLIARHGRAVLADRLRNRNCLAKAPVHDEFIDVVAKVIAVRFEAEGADEYLASFPPSEQRLSERRAAEFAGSSRREEAEAAARRAEAERLAAEKLAEEERERKEIEAQQIRREQASKAAEADIEREMDACTARKRAKGSDSAPAMGNCLNAASLALSDRLLEKKPEVVYDALRHACSRFRGERMREAR